MVVRVEEAILNVYTAPEEGAEESAVKRSDLADYDVAEDGSITYNVRKIQFTITGFYKPALEIMQPEATTEVGSAETAEVTE